MTKLAFEYGLFYSIVGFFFWELKGDFLFFFNVFFELCMNKPWIFKVLK